VIVISLLSLLLAIGAVVYLVAALMAPEKF
jgi:K+-transporting ATPase KdpF subunit